MTPKTMKAWRTAAKEVNVASRKAKEAKAIALQELRDSLRGIPGIAHAEVYGGGVILRLDGEWRLVVMLAASGGCSLSLYKGLHRHKAPWTAPYAYGGVGDIQERVRAAVKDLGINHS